MRIFLTSAAALLIAASATALADNQHKGAAGGAPTKPSAGAHVQPSHPAARPAPSAKRPPMVHRGRHHVRPMKRRHVVVRRPPPVAVHVDIGAKLHHVFHSNRRYHAGLYNRPFGWYAYDWRLGQRLPRGWFVREYWIGDFGMYGLFAPPEGLIWVRVGPDALLVNANSGEIINIYNDLFW